MKYIKSILNFIEWIKQQQAKLTNEHFHVMHRRMFTTNYELNRRSYTWGKQYDM